MVLGLGQVSVYAQSSGGTVAGVDYNNGGASQLPTLPSSQTAPETLGAVPASEAATSSTKSGSQFASRTTAKDDSLAKTGINFATYIVGGVVLLVIGFLIYGAALRRRKA